MEVEKPPFLQGLRCTSRINGLPCKTIRNRRSVFRLPRQSDKSASASRFASLNLSPHKPSPGENPRKGAAAPFLVVLRGLQRGKSKSPFAILSFDRQRRFLSHTRKKAGLKRFSAMTEKIWPAERRRRRTGSHRASGAYEYAAGGSNAAPSVQKKAPAGAKPCGG